MFTVSNSLLLLKPNILTHLHGALFLEATPTLQITLLPNKPTSLIESRKELSDSGTQNLILFHEFKQFRFYCP